MPAHNKSYYAFKSITGQYHSPDKKRADHAAKPTKKKPGRVSVQPDEELIDLIHRFIALHDEIRTKLDALMEMQGGEEATLTPTTQPGQQLKTEDQRDDGDAQVKDDHYADDGMELIHNPAISSTDDSKTVVLVQVRSINSDDKASKLLNMSDYCLEDLRGCYPCSVPM